MSPRSLLEITDVTVRFGGLVAVNAVSLTIEEAQITGIIGPNGAGKTTLFNVIAGIQPPTRGTVVFAGQEITHWAPHKRGRSGIARTFQRLEVFGTLTTRENILVAAETRRRWDHSVRPGAVADELIERLSLGAVADIEADTLPTGTQRLVELGRALAAGPRLLLLDEASSGVSNAETEAMAEVIRGLAADGLTVVLVEHDMAFVMGLCERIVMLDHGALVADGTPEEIQRDPAVQAAYLGTGER